MLGRWPDPRNVEFLAQVFSRRYTAATGPGTPSLLRGISCIRAARARCFSGDIVSSWMGTRSTRAYTLLELLNSRIRVRGTGRHASNEPSICATFIRPDLRQAGLDFVLQIRRKSASLRVETSVVATQPFVGTLRAPCLPLLQALPRLVFASHTGQSDAFSRRQED
jgi:hypothetical protein